MLSFAEKTKQTDPDLTFTETKLIESPSSASKTNKTRFAITTPEKMSQSADKEVEEENENILNILFRLEINSIQMTLYEEESFSVILNCCFFKTKDSYYILNLKKDKIKLIY